jgi:hypothetical protein
VSEPQHRLPFHICTGAIVFDVYAVLDLDYRLVREFETESEAEAFVAEANGTDIDTVRRKTIEHGRMLAEYRENLFRRSQARRNA